MNNAVAVNIKNNQCTYDGTDNGSKDNLIYTPIKMVPGVNALKKHLHKQPMRTHFLKASCTRASNNR